MKELEWGERRNIEGKFIFKALNLNLGYFCSSYLLQSPIPLSSVQFSFLFFLLLFNFSSHHLVNKRKILLTLSCTSFFSFFHHRLLSYCAQLKTTSSPNFPPIYFFCEEFGAVCTHSQLHIILFSAINPLSFKYLLNNSRANNKNFLTSSKKSQKFAYNQVDCHKSSFFYYNFWEENDSVYRWMKEEWVRKILFSPVKTWWWEKKGGLKEGAREKRK